MFAELSLKKNIIYLVNSDEMQKNILIKSFLFIAGRYCKWYARVYREWKKNRRKNLFFVMSRPASEDRPSWLSAISNLVFLAVFLFFSDTRVLHSNQPVRQVACCLSTSLLSPVYPLRVMCSGHSFLLMHQGSTIFLILCISFASITILFEIPMLLTRWLHGI